MFCQRYETTGVKPDKNVGKNCPEQSESLFSEGYRAIRASLTSLMNHITLNTPDLTISAWNT
jgi:hypothetical protein